MLRLALAIDGRRCFAGTTGIMNGYVRDENGRPAADVLVRAISASDFAKTYTDKRGFFSFLALAPDVYTVSAVKAGTSNADAYGVRINSDQTTFFIFRFSSYRRCGFAFNWTPLSSDQRSQQFMSLGVRQMEHYPPNVASLPAPIVPITPLITPVRCL